MPQVRCGRSQLTMTRGMQHPPRRQSMILQIAAWFRRLKPQSEIHVRAGFIVSGFDDVADLTDEPKPAATLPARLGRQVPGEWIGEPAAAIVDVADEHPLALVDPDASRRRAVYQRVGGSFAD